MSRPASRRGRGRDCDARDPGPGAVDGAPGRDRLLAARRGGRGARERMDRARLADRERRRAGDGHRGGAQLAARRALPRPSARARRDRRALGRQYRLARELPARRRRERDAVVLEARGAAGAGHRRAHLRGGDAQGRDELVRPLSGRAQPGLPRPRVGGCRGIGRGRRDRRAGRPLRGPADRDVFLLVLGRAHRSRRGGLLGGQARAVPLFGRRSLRHALAESRLDALAERPRPLAEGDLPGPRHGHPRGRLPVGSRAGGHAERQRRAARAGSGARAQALRPALDVVHRVARGGAAPGDEDRAARARRAQSRAAEGVGAARHGDAAGRRGLRLARHRLARGGRRRRRRALLPAPGRRVVALPARRGLALDAAPCP